MFELFVKVFAALALSGRVACNLSGQITLFAGSPMGGPDNANVNIPVTSASFMTVGGLFISTVGDIFVGEAGRPVIRKITPTGIVEPFSPAYYPINLCGDTLGYLYAVTNDEIQGIRPTGSVDFTADAYGSLTACDVDSHGNVYLQAINTLRVATRSHLEDETDAGILVASWPGLPSYGIFIDTTDQLYIPQSCTIQKLDLTDPDAGFVTVAGTLNGCSNAGDGGPALGARLDEISAVTGDTLGNLFVGCFNYIRYIDTTGIIHRMAGSDTEQGYAGDGGPATSALISSVLQMAAYDGYLYFTDSENNNIRRINYGAPTTAPTPSPTLAPTRSPTTVPSATPTILPTLGPSRSPTVVPSVAPSLSPTRGPTAAPTTVPTLLPTEGPTATPTLLPTLLPTQGPTEAPSKSPSGAPTAAPSPQPSLRPTATPSVASTTPLCRPPAVGSLLGLVCSLLWSDVLCCNK